MRNPFRLRASKRSVHDEQFVRLFAAGALDLLNDADEPWAGVVFLRSAPGGGKTTLLRLLTPGPLRKIFRMQDDPDVRPTRDALIKAGAVTVEGPAILGVMIGFSNEYRDLDEIGDTGVRAKGIFRALVNARIVLATLRAVLERSEKSYPDDLGQIRATWQPVDGATLPAEATGRELHKWASQIEEGVFDILDDLGGEGRPMPRAASGLEALHWLSSATLSDAAGHIELKRVLLLDDLQFLSDDQSSWLRETLTNARLPCGIWIAERLEALPAEDFLPRVPLKTATMTEKFGLSAAGESATWPMSSSWIRSPIFAPTKLTDSRDAASSRPWPRISTPPIGTTFLKPNVVRSNAAF